METIGIEQWEQQVNNSRDLSWGAGCLMWEKSLHADRTPLVKWKEGEGFEWEVGSYFFLFSAEMCLIQSTLLGDQLWNCIFWNEGGGWRAAAWGKFLEKLLGPLGPLLAQRQALQVSFRHNSLILLEKHKSFHFLFPTVFHWQKALDSASTFLFDEQ